MLTPGLCSVTFRHLKPEQICKLMNQAGLSAIEWGGDVHVPDVAAAKEVAKISADYGIVPASYGSYFKAGTGTTDDFERALECAMTLGAPNIRIWAGMKGSEQFTGMDRRLIIQEMQGCGELAMAAGVSMSLEFHPNTLTDTNESVGRLVTELGPTNVFLYWQPRWDLDEEHRLGGLMITMQRLTNLHVFTWKYGNGVAERLALSEGTGFLTEALKLSTQDGNDHNVFLEFVRDADENAFLEDAATLKGILSGINV